MANIHVIIVAGGSGSRFGSPLPKQFCEIDGRPVVMRAIDAIAAVCPEAKMTIALSPKEFDRWQALCSSHNFASPKLVAGGATRWESVKNALATVADDCDLVMVHDGARPFPSQRMLEDLISVMDDTATYGAVPVIAVTDSLRIVEDDSSAPFDRSKLRAVQTPQIFRYDLLRRAYDMPYQTIFTDDASVMEAAGYKNIVLTDGEPTCIKITHPLDIAIAEAILTSAK